MANNVEFNDNSIQVARELKEAVKRWLYEAGGELQTKIVRNSRTDMGQTKGSYRYEVDEDNGVCEVGSSLENAVWEEFGTGEYALNGDGRQGYWVYVKGQDPQSSSTTQSKTYTLQEAKKVVAILRSKGLEAYYTKGKRPNRPMMKAYESSKEPLERRLEQIIRDEVGG